MEKVTINAWVLTSDDRELIRRFRSSKIYLRWPRSITNEWEELKAAIQWDTLGRPDEFTKGGPNGQ